MTAEPEENPITPEPETEPLPTFGFNAYAERINGRFAMIGFAILMVLEIVTHQDLFTWLGLR
ncbi:chlorophyll a/b-binding protein [Spirulina sp. CCNP1310]|uniref:chlorophyll a/b-binding protein n=1 Tax=Spirulina sp. CCNP1310 TaxID=3110249 RepID=UPI002B1FC9F5|nr:chlorophyll a/b-binding protein [Spirulina sp. CCNP1310]MEA5421023.1 chlorophyll a/b-binding protein [Spirulina sp. CCNP1310]